MSIKHGTIVSPKFLAFVSALSKLFCVYGEKNYDNMLSRFHLIPERHGRTDRQTDGRTHNVRQTDLLYQYRASDNFQ